MQFTKTVFVPAQSTKHPMGGVVVPPIARKPSGAGHFPALRAGARRCRAMSGFAGFKTTSSHNKRLPNRQREPPDGPTRQIGDRYSLPETGAHGLPYSLRPGHGLRLPPAGGGSVKGIEPLTLPRARPCRQLKNCKRQKQNRPATNRTARKEYIKAESLERGGQLPPNRHSVTVGLIAFSGRAGGRRVAGAIAPAPRTAHALRTA